MRIQNLCSVVLCMFVMSLSAYTMWNLMWFLSSTQVSTENLPFKFTNLVVSLWLNTSLVFFFFIQHSYFKTSHIGNFLTRYRITTAIARSIYVILTSLAIQIIVMCWRPIPSFCFWKINTDNSVLWWVFSAIHLTAWAFIYGGSVLLDLPDLIGVKQIYYYCLNLPETSDLKSTELQRLYSHKRHPSFLGFLSLLWITPVMNIDRALLATVLTMYMAAAWDPTPDDRRYHQRQMLQKQQEISYSNRRKEMNSEYRNFRG